MRTLYQLTAQWLAAEAEQHDDVDLRATAAIQALPKPRPRRDLVSVVMARIVATSIWASRPVRYLVASSLVFLAVGMVATVNSATTALSIARMPVWRDLGQRFISTGYGLTVEILNASSTVIEAIASSSSSWLVGSFAPWLAMVLFLAGAAAMTVMSSWRDKQRWNHA